MYRMYNLAELTLSEISPKIFFFIFIFQDIESFDLEEFRHNFVNMTAFRLVDVEDVGVKKILKDMERFRNSDGSILDKSPTIKVS